MRHLNPLCLLPSLLAAVCAAVPVDLPRYRSMVDLPAGPDHEELVAVRLSADIFEATQLSLADIRIADPQNQSVPYLITQRTELTTDTSRQPVSLRRIAFNDNAEQNSVEVVYDRNSNDPPPGFLVIRTPLRNFEKAVTVLGSADGKTWQTLAESAVIFDASRFMDAARLEVPFREAHHQLYKVIIHDVTDTKTSPVSELSRFLGGAETGQVQYTDRSATILNRDFRIDRIEFGRTLVRESVSRTRLIPVAVTNLAIAPADDQTKKTTVRFDARRSPVTSLRLLTQSRNFSRRFILYALDPGAPVPAPPRRELARGTLTSFSFRSLVQDSTEIGFPENRGPVYELEIENGDNPALDITGVTLKGPEYQVLYFSRPDSACRLYFGNAESKKPEFDVTLIQTALDRGLAAVRLPDLGPARANPDRAKGATGFRFNKKAALAGAMVVMVLALGAALYKAARRSETGGGGDAST